MNKATDNLKVKLFADGADLAGMLEMAAKPYISGLTTNPTLMRKAGISNYELFAKNVLKEIPNKPISLEVFSDNFEEMKSQAFKISSWSENVFVKIPITNTAGESSKKLVSELTSAGVKVNVTAIMSLNQVEDVMEALDPGTSSYVSVFAGRIADTGVDPVPLMRDCLNILSSNKNTELIWASPRELLNIFQAEAIGCHVITATNDILRKLDLIGKDLEEYSLETVEMFYNDGLEAGYNI